MDERRRGKNKANEEDQIKSQCVEAVEKRIKASTQVESNGEWFSGHTLVAFEVLGY